MAEPSKAYCCLDHPGGGGGYGNLPSGGEAGQVIKRSVGGEAVWSDLLDAEALSEISGNITFPSHTHIFSGLSSEVNINHNLDKHISYIMVDSFQNVVYPAIKVIDSNNICVSAGEALTGSIYIY